MSINVFINVFIYLCVYLYINLFLILESLVLHIGEAQGENEQRKRKRDVTAVWRRVYSVITTGAFIEHTLGHTWRGA